MTTTPDSKNIVEELSLLRTLAAIVDDPDFKASHVPLDGEGIVRGDYGIPSIFRRLDEIDKDDISYYEVQEALSEETAMLCKDLSDRLRGERWKTLKALEWWLSQMPSHDADEAAALLIADIATIETTARGLRSLAGGYAYRNQVQREKKSAEEWRKATQP